MANSLAKAEIQKFLEELSHHYFQPTKVYLLGGSALCFLGSPRRTIDIDCAIDVSSEDFETVVEKIARQMTLEVEIISLEEFIPLPRQTETRHQRVGQFGSIVVYVYDPYSIALSKLARGFDTDIQDVLFLLERGIITLEHLSNFVEDALPVAWDYDINPTEMNKYLGVVKKLYLG